jgi:hypothetical protein
VNESENQERVELHKRETVGFKEQFQILPIVTGGLKPYPLFVLKAVQEVSERGKALVIVCKRPRERDETASLVKDGAVVLEFGNVNAYKVHGFTPFQNMHCCFRRRLAYVFTLIKTLNVNQLITNSDKPLRFESLPNSLAVIF